MGTKMANSSEHRIYEFGDYRLDADHLMLYRGHDEISLAPKAVETLLALVERSGEIVRKEELLERIWPDSFVDESNLFLYLSVLRKTLGKQDSGKPFLETLRRRGYRFNGQAHVVREVIDDNRDAGLDDNLEMVERTLPDANREGIGKRNSLRHVLWLSLGAIVLTGVFAASSYWRSGPLKAHADAPRGTKNVEAWDYYLKGSYQLGRVTPPDIQKSIEYFQKAIDRDPAYALAYAALSRAYISLPPSSDCPPTACFPKAKAAAQKALEIDDRLAEGHSVMGAILFWYDWDWKGSETQCRQAITLDPNSADAHYTYAHLLSNTGQHTEALIEMKLARRLDPITLRNAALESQFLLHAGQTEEALDRLRKTVDLEPKFWLGHLLLSSTYIEKGMYTEAVAEADLAKESSGASNHPLAFKGYALAKAGKKAEAQLVLNELSRQSTEGFVPPYYFALI
jgi:DNA-binding winged helix-turn-helix (wHTH) protein/Tfp pilus assembly protein PilF